MSGDYQLNDTIYIPFTTRAFATGVPTTLAGSPVVTGHRDANITQFTTGITLAADFDGIGGLNMITVVATAANNYAAGETYTLYLSAGTVSSVSVVGEVVGHFTLDMSAAALDLANGTDGLGAIKGDTAAVKVVADKFVFTVANQVDANAVAISDDAIAADNLELFTEGVALGTLPKVDTDEMDGSTDAPTILRIVYDAIVLCDVAAVSGADITLSAVVNTLSTTSNTYNGCLLVSVEDQGSNLRFGQPRTIAAWNGSTLVATVDSAFTALNVNDRVIIWPYGANTHVDASGLVDITQAAADKAWGTAARVLTANTNFNDPTAAAIADAVLDEPIEDHDTQGNVGWSVALGVYAGSDGPGIYVDSGAANTNTVVGTDGTEINPVSTFAAARTIADALGLRIYYLEGNSDATLAATHVDWEFIGLGSVMDNVVNLGSQDVSRSLFRNLSLEGTQGGTGRITARDCALQDPGAGDTTLHIFAERSGIVDRIQVDTSNDNVFDQCYSLVAGTAAPVIQATGASGTISIRHYSGGMEFETLSASHNVTWEGIGQVIFNADCNVNANVSIRGIGSITDNTAGMASLTETSLMNMTKVNTEADTALADYDPPTRTEATSDKDSIETNIAALNDYDPTAQLAEGYAANGVAPTSVQLWFAVHQMLMDFSISGTTLTVEKLDGTTAFLVTLDDGTNPTSANRA